MKDISKKSFTKKKKKTVSQESKNKKINYESKSCFTKKQ